MNRTRIGQKLRILRGNTPIQTVADACRVTANAISNYEAGARVPNDEIKQALAKYYGLTVQEIFYDD